MGLLDSKGRYVTLNLSGCCLGYEAGARIRRRWVPSMVGQAGIRREGTCSDTSRVHGGLSIGASGFPIWGNPALRGGIPLSAISTLTHLRLVDHDSYLPRHLRRPLSP
jgi:hypothetical protein